MKDFLLKHPESIIKYEHAEILYFLLNSMAIGLVLCLITYFSRILFFNEKKESFEDRSNLILGTSNIIYLCTGLTAIMILVNENLARAFSIGAAIALVRFRVKLGNKGAAANILFGIICGIACGLDQVPMAWLLTVVYAVISFGTCFLVRGSVSENSSESNLERG